jgi:hypothetical protein
VKRDVIVKLTVLPSKAICQNLPHSKQRFRKLPSTIQVIEGPKERKNKVTVEFMLTRDEKGRKERLDHFCTS